MPELGQVIAGKYRLERILGQGAFATVWAAASIVLDRDVALKILAEGPARKRSTVERFIKEARICATPIHPTIVAVEDIGQTEQGLPYLVMELLEGRTLDDVLRKTGALPWSMVLELSRHLLEGLSAAHERNIIHRDIKPGNLFLMRDPNAGPPLRILDLGLARDLSSEDKRLTQTGQVVGTANYLPPETLLDEQPKGGTKAGDVFAVGMVMFAALTGRFPFLAGSAKSNPAAEVYARAKFYKSREPLPGPTDYDTSVPVALDKIVRRALAIDPSERFENCIAMCDALVGAMTEMTPCGTRDSLAETRIDYYRPEMETCIETEPPDVWAALFDFANIQSSGPPLVPQVATSPRPVLSVNSSAAPPPEGAPLGGLPAASSPPMPATMFSPAPPPPPHEARVTVHSRPSSKPSKKKSKVVLILLGAVAGAILSVALLGAIVVWQLYIR